MIAPPARPPARPPADHVFSIAAVQSVTAAGKICILDIDVQGVKSVRNAGRSVLDPHYLFISAPSMEVLEARLRGRYGVRCGVVRCSYLIGCCGGWVSLGSPRRECTYVIHVICEHGRESLPANDALTLGF